MYVMLATALLAVLSVVDVVANTETGRLQVLLAGSSLTLACVVIGGLLLRRGLGGSAR